MSTLRLHTYSSLSADIAARAEELALTVKGGPGSGPHKHDEESSKDDKHSAHDKAVRALADRGWKDKRYKDEYKHPDFPGQRIHIYKNEGKEGQFSRYTGGKDGKWTRLAPLSKIEEHLNHLHSKSLKATHKFSTVQLNLPTTVAKQIRALARQVADADLADDGREQTPHVTVKFGLDTDSPADLLRLLSNQPPVRITLGKLEVFDAAETGAAFDVLTVEVNSPDLERLNRVIVDALPTVQTHNFYHPHATVAYVQPGKGAEYTALDNPLEGTTLTVDRLMFSNQDGEETTIPLEGVGVMSNVNKVDDELYKSLQVGITARLAELKGGPGSGPHKKDGGAEGQQHDSRAHETVQQARRDLTKLSSRVASGNVDESTLRRSLRDISMSVAEHSTNHPAAANVEKQLDQLRRDLFTEKVSVKDSEGRIDSIRHGIFKLDESDFKKSLKAEFNEEAHPRGEGGKFASGGSSSSEGDKQDAESNGHAWKEVNAALTEHLTPQEKTAVVSGLHQKLQTNEGPRTYQKQDIEKVLTRVGVGEKRREQVLSKLG